MPFGLCNAPGTMQYLVNDALREFLDIFCTAYLDDIIIYSNSIEDYIEYVRLVLEKLQAYHLYVKPEKCVFYVSKVEFLGFRIGRERVQPNPTKLNTIKS